MRAAGPAPHPQGGPQPRPRRGQRYATLILNLPGSELGVRENLGAVLPVLAHAVELLAGVTEHPPVAAPTS